MLIRPILERETQLTAPVASALRILVLCLAKEADALKDLNLAEKFIQIAAELTWLERRYAGDDLPVEAIALAVS